MKLHFRHRKNGVHVFRVDTENRERRIQLVHIANIDKHGAIVAHRRNAPTDAERDEMLAWHAGLTDRLTGDGLSTMEKETVRLNHFIHWIMQKATPEELDEHAEVLLMALLDARQVVVRAMAKSLSSSQGATHEHDGEPEDS